MDCICLATFGLVTLFVAAVLLRRPRFRPWGGRGTREESQWWVERKHDRLWRRPDEDDEDDED